MSKVDILGNGCWRWLGAVTANGYGRTQVDGIPAMAHRYAYELQENTLRSDGITALNAAKTKCTNGHPFTAENTYLIPNGGGRACRACRREADRRHKLKAKAGAA